MSVQQEVIPKSLKKSSIFTKIKIGIAVIFMFFFVIAATLGILYLTNERAKNIIDKQIQSYLSQKELMDKVNSRGASDPRISELAKYYSNMSVEDASAKMLEIKKSDKKVYEYIMSSMSVINPDKLKKINDAIVMLESKSDIVKQEYDEMKQNIDAQNSDISKHYASLGIKGAIDAIQKELQTSMNYEKVSSVLETMKPDEVAKILYYTNPMYIEGIKNRFDKEFKENVDRQRQVYQEFLRKNASFGKLYEKSEEKLAAKDLQNANNYKNEDLAVIFSNMDYLSSAKILNRFEDENKVQEVLKAIKDVEDYQINFEGSLSVVIANSLKVLKKYDEDVDTLRKAYEKMQASDLANIIDKLVNDKPVYRNYKIDHTRDFSITEKQMAIDALKKMKPALVGQLLAELKNNDKVDKAAYISREIGIPNSAN